MCFLGFPSATWWYVCSRAAKDGTIGRWGTCMAVQRRNVDRSAPLKNPLPQAVLPIVQRIEALPGTPQVGCIRHLQLPVLCCMAREQMGLV